MPGTIGTAMQIALLTRLGLAGPAGRALGGAHAGCECGENGVQVLYRVLIAAKHQAITPLKPPDAAARAAVEQPDTALGEFPGAPDIVAVVRVASVDDNVPSGHFSGHRLDGSLGNVTGGRPAPPPPGAPPARRRLRHGARPGRPPPAH